MKPIDYLLRQMELEGIKRAGEDLITRISPNVDEFPLVLCARTADNEGLVCFDDELPREVRARMPMDDLRALKTRSGDRSFGNVRHPRKGKPVQDLPLPGWFSGRRVWRGEMLSARTTRRSALLASADWLIRSLQSSRMEKSYRLVSPPGKTPPARKHGFSPIPTSGIKGWLRE